MPNYIGIILYHHGKEVAVFKDIWEVMDWFHTQGNSSMFFSLTHLGYTVKEVQGEPITN